MALKKLCIFISDHSRSLHARRYPLLDLVDVFRYFASMGLLTLIMSDLR
jgi:hypothetical protein